MSLTNATSHRASTLLVSSVGTIATILAVMAIVALIEVVIPLRKRNRWNASQWLYLRRRCGRPREQAAQLPVSSENLYSAKQATRRKRETPSTGSVIAFSLPMPTNASARTILVLRPTP